ncbi:MAG TPA: isopentenyl phosphate kinase [Phototrophicaceae bacterium]|jgi:isopentenyl phosphate kinase|nr:isopentenyl phosphate kinase [Phototrophicaceae bacterium]
MTITLVKLGGSLITDKLVESSFRVDVTHRIASEIAEAIRQKPDLQLIIGHGSGSFGHFAAKRHHTVEGVHTREQWHGFTEVATAASTLNGLVAETMRSAGLPIWRIQPSASIVCQDGVIQQMALGPLQAALVGGIIPLVYGDVAVDSVRGGTIASTETVFTYLVEHLPVSQVLLLGEVPGVYDPEGTVIPEVTPSNFDTMRDFLGGSAGVDVTGGMLTKVQDMLALVEQIAGLRVWIMDGTQPGLLKQSLMGEGQFGTLIHAGTTHTGSHAG